VPKVLEKFILGEGLGDTPRQYIIHTESPRFIGELFEDDAGSSYHLGETMWLDPVTDAQIVARIMREMGEFLQAYDTHTDRFLAEHGSDAWKIFGADDE
jgi:hypothetical protein